MYCPVAHLIYYNQWEFNVTEVLNCFVVLHGEDVNDSEVWQKARSVKLHRGPSRIDSSMRWNCLYCETTRSQRSQWSNDHTVCGVFLQLINVYNWKYSLPANSCLILHPIVHTCTPRPIILQYNFLFSKILISVKNTNVTCILIQQNVTSL